MPETVEVQTPVPMTASVEVYTLCTAVEFTLFGKQATFRESGSWNREAAQSVADEWNAHFAREWEKVQQTSEALMHQFSDALRAEGVSAEVIDKAVASVVEYVKG